MTGRLFFAHKTSLNFKKYSKVIVSNDISVHSIPGLFANNIIYLKS